MAANHARPESNQKIVVCPVQPDLSLARALQETKWLVPVTHCRHSDRAVDKLANGPKPCEVVLAMLRKADRH